MPTTVRDHVVEILTRWRLDTVFGLPGDGINGLVEAFRKAQQQIRYVHCRHVDPLEPPWPPVITQDEQKKLLAAMRRGERNRTPIGLSIGRHAAQEFTFSESPFGVAGRVLELLTGKD